MADDLSKLSGDTLADIGKLRARLKSMTDEELRRFGRAAALLPELSIQVEEARAEWGKRLAERKRKDTKPR